jgi:KDO2-lipid IV(A) lauroyltransferase
VFERDIEASLADLRDRNGIDRQVVQGMFFHSVLNYLSLFSLPYMQPKTILNSIQVNGIDHLEAALALGKGAILFSPHLGPFNYMVQWLVIKGYRVTVPVERLQDQRMLGLVLKLRGSHGVQFVPLGGVSPMRKIMQALGNNQIVLIAADRVIEGKSITLPFFGAQALFPLGPAILAQRTGAPLVGVFGWYTTSTGYKTRECSTHNANTIPMQGEFIPLSLALNEEDRTNVHCLVRGMVERMQPFIAAHPEQWLVFYPVWVKN